MRFLEWMNDKLLQSSVEPFKDFGLRSSCLCLSAQSLINDNDFESGAFKKHKDQSKTDENYHYSYDESNVFKKYFEEEAFPTTEHFNGFRTIGTLGSEAPLSGPATSTFAISFENTSLIPTKVTEEELKLANYKLEKFLEAQCKDKWCDESSGRTSFVSAITFTGKQLEGDEEEAKRKAIICPLQGYLFRSSVELQEKAVEMKEENAASNEKIVKKNSTPQRMKKVLQMFHRKIHLESSPPEKKSCLKHHKEGFRHENKSKFAELPTQISMLKSKMSLPQDDTNSRNSTAKGGHWIKTDADYLVLELRSEGI